MKIAVWTEVIRMLWSVVVLVSALCLPLTPLEATAQERFAVEGYEVTVTTRPHQFILPSGSRGVGWDLVVDVHRAGKRVAAITDNFLNGYGVLEDYGPQPGFNTPAEVQAYWEEKDSIETHWEPIGGLTLINNIPDASLRRSLTAKWAVLYRRIFAAVSRRMVLTRFILDGQGMRAIVEEAPPKRKGIERRASRAPRKPLIPF